MDAMSLIASIGLIAVGFLLLIKGAGWLVDGSSAIAQKLGIPDLAIGLTIVAFGTSAPELVVNIVASIQGNSDIAIGNVVGSNIFNILLILGIAALINPLHIQRSTVLKEIPFSLLAAVLLFVMANDIAVDGLDFSALTRSDGLALIGFFLIFLYYTFGLQQTDTSDTPSVSNTSLPFACFLVLAGLGSLVLGGKLTVDAAVTMAEMLGVSESLIGLTIVAAGTSLPELATSTVAARKGKADIAVGNIIGSNIFNVFWILGMSAVIHPIPFSPAANVDLSVLVATTVLLFYLIHTGLPHRRLLFWRQKRGHILTRIEGGILVGCYIAYTAFLIVRG